MVDEIENIYPKIGNGGSSCHIIDKRELDIPHPLPRSLFSSGSKETVNLVTQPFYQPPHSDDQSRVHVTQYAIYSAPAICIAAIASSRETKPQPGQFSHVCKLGVQGNTDQIEPLGYWSLTSFLRKGRSCGRVGLRLRPPQIPLISYIKSRLVHGITGPITA